MQKEHTWAQAALVDPVEHFGALALELGDPGLLLGQLALELVNLLHVGADGLVEGLGQQVGHGGGAVVQRRGRLAQLGRHGTVAVGHGLTRGQDGFLGLLRARVHVTVLGRRRDLVLVLVLLLLLLRGLGAARVWALLVILVERLRAGRGVVVYVAVCARRAAPEEHSVGEEKSAAAAGGAAAALYGVEGLVVSGVKLHAGARREWLGRARYRNADG